MFDPAKPDQELGPHTMIERSNIQVRAGMIDLKKVLHKVMEETPQEKTVGVYTCAPEGYMSQLEYLSTKDHTIVFQREVFNW